MFPKSWNKDPGPPLARKARGQFTQRQIVREGCSSNPYRKSYPLLTANFSCCREQRPDAPNESSYPARVLNTSRLCLDPHLKAKVRDERKSVVPAHVFSQGDLVFSEVYKGPFCFKEETKPNKVLTVQGLRVTEGYTGHRGKLKKPLN